MEQPIKVGLIHRDSPRVIHHRSAGWWSYGVPEFSVTHIPVRKGFRLSKNVTSQFDVLVYEDAKIYGTIEHPRPPTLYHVVDSTLSEDHYKHRLNEAKRNADLILLDWDDPRRFTHLGIPVERFAYCVNDTLYYPRNKVRDLGSHMGDSQERTDLQAWLKHWCKVSEVDYSIGKRGGRDYPNALAEAKVIINYNRNILTRSHRIMDTMASRTCLITNPFPAIEGDGFIENVHYLKFENFRDLDVQITFALGDSNIWEIVANNGYKHVMAHHTWATRASELQKTIQTYFNI